MYAQWKNDAFSTLAGALTTAATSLTVAAGHGDRFPVIAAPNWMMLTLQDAAGNVERVKVTARAGVSDVMTIERAQEGTTAREWAIGTPVRLQLTAAFVNTLVTKDDPETLTNKTLNASFCATPTAGDNSTKLSNTAFIADAIATAVAATKQALYPVGSIYTNAASATNPATLLGFGTWEAFGAGRVLVGLNAADPSFDLLGETGGSKDAIAVAHDHSFSATTGGQSASHSHTGYTDSQGAHTHTTAMGTANGISSGCYTGGAQTATDNSCGTRDTSSAGSHAHNVQTYNASNDHSHNVSGTTGSAGASGVNANLQPYVVVHMWKRTA